MCSRRAAEKAIEEGRVKVNGELAEIGMKVRPEKDKIQFDNKVISKKRNSHCVYVMLNKPEGYLCTMSDDKGRKSVTELVGAVKTRIYPVGRLDMNSEGLLIMTNDGELTNKLTHPSHSIPKVYLVTLIGIIPKEKIAELSQVSEIDGCKIQPVESVIDKYNESTTVVRMTLYEGKNRQIRKMCEQCELSIKRLKRVSIGKLELDVPKGKWRYLTKEEIEYLKKE